MENQKYFTKKYSRIIFIVMAILILGLTILVASPYINTIILALIVSYILQPLYNFLTKKLKTKKVSASFLSTAITMLFTLVIGFFIVIAVINVISIVLDQLGQLRVENNVSARYLKDAIDWVNMQSEAINIPLNITLQEIVSNVKDLVSSVLNNILAAVSSISTFSVDIIFKLIIFYGLIFLIVPNFEDMINFIKKVSPFEDEITKLYIDRTLETSKAMVWGMLIIALADGLAAALILYALGTPYVLLIALLVAIFSFLPVLGTGMITLPIALIYILSGRIWQGILLAVFQIVVIGNMDTIFRAKLIPKSVRMPMFISFIAIFGGLALWGISGLIYGPVVFILFLTTIEVLRKYYLPNNKKK